MVREGGNWIDDIECGCHPHPSESYHSRLPHPEVSQRRWLPSFCIVGPLRDLHLQLLLPTFPLSIVINIDHVYSFTSHGQRLTSPYLFTAHAGRLNVITLCRREARGVRLLSRPAQ